MKRILVTGGRHFANPTEVHRVLQPYGRCVIIEGGASGADSLAGAYADAQGIPHIKHPAQWKQLGPRAGPIRSAEMLDDWKPDLVIALPGGTGTANTVAQAKKRGIEVKDLRIKVIPFPG